MQTLRHDLQTGTPAPKVSVCIDVFNYARFLPAAIESVLIQEFADYELLIGDDASTDGSYDVAMAFAEKNSNIRVYRNERNLGMIRNRNTCLRAARGEYVKILHADDRFHGSHALRTMVDALDRNPGMSLVASAMWLMDDREQLVRQWAYFQASRPLTGTRVISRCLAEGRNLIGPPTATLFRRHLATRGFDETFFHSSDWEMWFHLLEQGCFGWIPEPLVDYRLHENQQTEKDKGTLTRCEDMLALLNRYLDRPYVAFSKIFKGMLRHRAVAEYVRQSRRLNLPAGQFLLQSEGVWKHRASAPWFSLLSMLHRQVRSIKRKFPAPDREPSKRNWHHPPGLNVAGFFQGEYGIGDSSRAFHRLIKDSRIPAVFLNIHNKVHRNLDSSAGHFATSNPYSVNLMTFSFDYARRFSRDRGRRFFKNRHNIALWYWEMEKFPVRWHPCFEFYDEIWVATEFCLDSLKAVSPIPVVHVGYPFPVEPPPPADRASFGLPEAPFLFLFNFDFHSVVARKNPEGVIAAFRKAFGDRPENAGLVMKTINSAWHPEEAARLESLTAGMNVVWLHAHLEGAKMKQLFQSTDCYVSLHRSEGLGLGMARALSYGKPVIATNYSGNLEFMNPENSRLVSYELVELDRDYGVYEAGNFWAEPNLEDAARQMRWVFEHPEEAVQVGLRGQSDLKRTMNPSLVLETIQRRLREVDPRFSLI